MEILLIGPGQDKDRKIILESQKREFSEDDSVISIDMDPSSNPDYLMDLNDVFPYPGLPFDDDTFDEIHAYNVLEHIGVQGDWKGFFKEFGEYHRILKDNGQFFILVPIGADAFADPGHTRFFHVNHFGFLNQKFYDRNLDLATCCTDYRWFWKKNFDVLLMEKQEDHHIAIILRKT